MQTAATRNKTLKLSRDVLDFARDRGLTAFLPALKEALQRVFPDAVRIGAEVHEDPETAGLRWILFEPEVPWETTEQALRATNEWHNAVEAVCPKPLLSQLSLIVRRRP